MDRELLLEIRRCLLDLNDVLERYLQMERTAKLRQEAKEGRLVKPITAPRHDEVFVEGMKALDRDDPI